ncbi:ABC transporter permease [Ventosimonas gracilis]|uniref:ABC transporter permease n=1 Tax=Ventosimonas gracilis TaxID=1680762 RepID=A0A139SXT0_9GAMM|nr:sulfate ABC transporter substrate-binding protein [Ventosimonas gracilis]KXU39416.1 ABC transporter permease [Ventosimonas gracilis]
MKPSFFRLAALLLAAPLTAWAADISLLNVSYDPTRELYQQYNRAFAAHWHEKTGDTLNIRTSHAGSGKQARSVIDGLQADVVTLALAFDVDALHQHGKLLPEDWIKRLPNNSSPYTSTIVFLVRKDNPKNIRDWDDLIKPEIAVITPNPKTSGGARWNYLAAWAWANKTFAGDESKIRDYIGKLLANVPVLDTGARGATTTFVERGVGDVLLAWENEALLALRELGAGSFDIVAPSLSILAEPSVALVDKIVDKRGTREVAQAYLEYLYSEQGQHIAAENYYRPRLPAVAAQYTSVFPVLNLVTVDEAFGGWQNAQATHFADGGTFDQIYQK